MNAAARVPAHGRARGAVPAAARARDGRSAPATWAEQVLGLQRAAGNRATRELLGAGGGAVVQAKAAGPGDGAAAGRSAGGAGDTGIPSPVRAKMETALGADFSGVRVHTGSSRAAALGAVAYTQGSDIHVAPGHWSPETTRGQEVLGHELWHVVQQRAGRVRATTQYKGVGLNDDAGLEAEADAMGARAARAPAGGASERAGLTDGPLPGLPSGDAAAGPIQRITYAIDHPATRDFADVVEDARAFGNRPLVTTPAQFVERYRAPDNTLNIFAHGNKEDVGGMTPAALARHLVNECRLLTTKLRRVVLHSCDSAVPDDRQGALGQVYAKELQDELMARSRHMVVTGQRGHAVTDSRGRTRVFRPGVDEDGYKRERDAARRANDPGAVRDIEDRDLMDATATYHRLDETMRHDGGIDLEEILEDPVALEARSEEIEVFVAWKERETAIDRYEGPDEEPKNSGVHPIER